METDSLNHCTKLYGVNPLSGVLPLPMEAKRNALTALDTKFYFYVHFEGFFKSLLERYPDYLSAGLEKSVTFLLVCPCVQLLCSGLNAR